MKHISGLLISLLLNSTAIAQGITPAIPANLPPSGAAGGDLAGTYPNPTIKASVGLTGAPTTPSLTVNAASGLGYVEFGAQASTPATPVANTFRIFADSTGNFNWIGANGYTRTFDGTANTANRAYTLPDVSDTFAMLAATQTLTNKTYSGISATLSGGTVTTSTPVIDLTQTWNNAGVIFTGIRSNITNTASNVGSYLIDLQVGGVSKFTVDRTGAAGFAGGVNILSGQAVQFDYTGSNNYNIGKVGTNIVLNSTGNYVFTSGGTNSVTMTPGASNLAAFNGGVAATALQTDSSNRAFAGDTGLTAAKFQVVNHTNVDTAGAGTAAVWADNLLGQATALTATNARTYTTAATLYIPGAPVASTNVTVTTPYALDVASGNSNFGGAVNLSGTLTAGTNVQAGGSSSFIFGGRERFSSPADGSVTLMNSASTNSFTLSSPAATATPVMQLGALDAAAPVIQTEGVQSVVAGTSNTAGVLRKFLDSAGTGNQNGGGYEFDCHLAGGSGTAQNAATACFGISGVGDLKSVGTIPVVTGTGSPTIAVGSTDTAGEATGGTLATSLVITFATAKTNAPFCTVTSQSAVASFGYTISTTAITISLTATTGEKVDYNCFQH